MGRDGRTPSSTDRRGGKMSGDPWLLQTPASSCGPYGSDGDFVGADRGLALLKQLESILEKDALISLAFELPVLVELGLCLLSRCSHLVRFRFHCYLLGFATPGRACSIDYKDVEDGEKETVVLDLCVNLEEAGQEEHCMDMSLSCECLPRASTDSSLLKVRLPMIF